MNDTKLMDMAVHRLLMKMKNTFVSFQFRLTLLVMMKNWVTSRVKFGFHDGLKTCGYEAIGHFILPAPSWSKEHYLPLEERIRSLRERYALDPGRTEMLDSIQNEIEVFRKYCDYYGYVFYVMSCP